MMRLPNRKKVKMPQHVFTYGTLIMPQVMQAVCGMTFEHVSASIDGFARFGIKNKVFPGIIRDKDSMVDGVLYLNVDDQALKRLDFFEDKEYERIKVNAELDGGKKVEAFAYLIAPAYESILTREPWNLKRFKEVEFDSYLKHARGLMRNYK
jgi:gamma-glutamylcyclotransferase (GGCT)/AIG2-like uncharacterized protein YtfP